MWVFGYWGGVGWGVVSGVFGMGWERGERDVF